MQINTNEQRRFSFIVSFSTHVVKLIHSTLEPLKSDANVGVVAKPGIATGSRSKKQGFIRERYPWIRGSNVRYTATEQIPSTPFVSLSILWKGVFIQLWKDGSNFPFYSYNNYFRKYINYLRQSSIALKDPNVF